MKPVCVILAGGRSLRMGGDHKALMALDGTAMLSRVLTALRPQVGAVLINSNADPDLFHAYDLPVLADSLPGYHGPLAGLLTGMLWARRHHPEASHILSAPCDSPFLPPDLVVRLSHALGHMPGSGRHIAIARDLEHRHPTIGLWPVCLAERLAEDLGQNGVRSMQHWLSNFAVRDALFDVQALRNINTPQDLHALQAQRALHLANSKTA